MIIDDTIIAFINIIFFGLNFSCKNALAQSKKLMARIAPTNLKMIPDKPVIRIISTGIFKFGILICWLVFLKNVLSPNRITKALTILGKKPGPMSEDVPKLY